MKVPNRLPEKGTANRRKLTIRYKVARRDGLKCKLCGCSNINRLTIDHIIPVSLGGDDNIENLQILCLLCHKEIDKLLGNKDNYDIQ